MNAKKFRKHFKTFFVREELPDGKIAQIPVCIKRGEEVIKKIITNKNSPFNES